MTFEIALAKPVTPDTIPPSADVVAAAKAIFPDTVQWKAGKKYVDDLVQTYSAKINGATWFARTSFHGPEDGSFDEFWNGLGVDHATHEAEYVPDIDKATLLKEIEPSTSEVWSLHYQFGALVSPRTFTVLLVTALEKVEGTERRQGYVISVPFTTAGDAELAAKEEPGVKGRYAAVERLTELGDGTLEWRMATTSSPGGLIPDFLATPAIPKAIAQDVKHFLKWLKKKEGPTS